MKKIAITFVLFLCTLSFWAETVEIDGVYYELIKKMKIANVVSGDKKYSGVIIIPKSVVYDDIKYDVTAIGNFAFYYCPNLTAITIPNSVTSIGESAFMDCSSLTSLAIPNSVTNIGESAFMRSALTSIKIPESVTKINNATFKSCSGLTSIFIPNSVTSIGKEAFYGCTSLTSIKIPNNVTSIEEGSFRDCEALASIMIPECVTTISEFAFYCCRKLNSVEIPNNVTTIGAFAFAGCGCLTSITIPNSVTSVGRGAFFECSSLASVSILPGVTSIDSQAFYKCSSLTSVTISNGVTSIGQEAFYGCSGLTSVMIGSSIKNIESGVFSKCGELTDVYCYAESVPNTASNAFEDSYIEYATLHVSESSLDAYKTSDPWNKFQNIVMIKPEYFLTYMVDNKEYKSYQVEEGTIITPEVEPTKEGYTFSGWSEIPSTMPAHDVTVTGTFTINSYTLTYMVDGKEYKKASVKYGSSITAEAAPTKEGYTFSGWSEIPSTMPAHDVTVTGTFTVNQYKVTFKYGKNVLTTIDVDYGAVIPLPESLNSERYTLIEWLDVPETMPARDIIIYADYVDGIDTITADSKDVQYIQMNGMYTNELKQGLNIIRTKDGKTQKVWVK